MATGADKRGIPTPMQWAFAVRESDTGVPFAEAIAQVDRSRYTALQEQAGDSGFTLATGEPPLAPSSAHDTFG